MSLLDITKENLFRNKAILFIFPYDANGFGRISRSVNSSIALCAIGLGIARLDSLSVRRERENGFLEGFLLEASTRTLDTIDQLDAKISNAFVIRSGGV